MSVNYFDNWGKFDDMCRFINKNAHMTAFENFEDIVIRLEKVVTDKTADMFNSKNSFLWFALFAKCIELELADKRFIEFMDKFDESLHSKKINGNSYDDKAVKSLVQNMVSSASGGLQIT